MFEGDRPLFGLALHTSSPQLGLILSNFSEITRVQTWDLDRELSSYLQLYLVEFLAPQSWQDLAFLSVAQGPGSFTSTRIGIVTARTLAQQLALPLFAVSTLAAIVWAEKHRFALNSLIPVQMNATRGQIYTAIYQMANETTGLTAVLSDTIMTPEAWQQTRQDLKITQQPLESPLNLGKTVPSVLELAYFDWQQGKRPQWSEVLPFYGISVW